MTVAPDERAARIRAARSYRGLKQPVLARELGVSVTTLSRWERGEVAPDDATLQRIAEVCDVPQWFMASGFDAPPEPDDPTINERMEALERKLEVVDSLIAEVRTLRSAISESRF